MSDPEATSELRRPENEAEALGPASEPAQRAPFRALRFEQLPERPRLPHSYEQSEARELTLASRDFGTMRVHVRVAGAPDAPPLLLVHGLMTSSYSFRYVMAPLAQHFRVYVPDLPGAGRTEKICDRPYHAEALARWIGELVDALGIRGCATVGNSLGGFLCLRLALDQPDAIGRLVNLHSPSFAQLRHHALHAALSTVLGPRLLVAMIRRDAERWAHRNVHYWDETRKSREEARAYGAPLAEPGGAEAFVRWLREAVAPAGLSALEDELRTRRDAGRAFPVPLTLVYARRDPMVSPAHGARLAALVPGARFVWMDETSHFPHVDTPERLLAEIVPFLRER